MSPQSRYLEWGVLLSASSLGNWKLDMGEGSCLPSMPRIMPWSARWPQQLSCPCGLVKRICMTSESEKDETERTGLTWQVTPTKDRVRTRGRMRVDPRLRAWHIYLCCGSKPPMAWPPGSRQGWPEICFLLLVAGRNTRCFGASHPGQLHGHVPSHQSPSQRQETLVKETIH